MRPDGRGGKVEQNDNIFLLLDQTFGTSTIFSGLNGRVSGSSKWMRQLLRERATHVGHFLQTFIDPAIRSGYHSGLLREIEWAMFCSIIVLPALGGGDTSTTLAFAERCPDL